MFSRSSLRRFAVTGGLSFLLVAACTGSDAQLPDDSQSLLPRDDSGDDGGRRDSGTKPRTDAGGGAVDAGKDAAGPVDPSYPFAVGYETVQAGGKTHDYIVVVPQNRATAFLPIVFGYHGDGGAAQGSKDYFQVEKTTAQNAIVVYPSCPANPAWNIYGGAANEYLAAFDATLEQVATAYGGDRTKVTAFGLSSGGFFASVLGCFRSAQLQAIGVMAGGAPFPANDGSTGTWVEGQPATTKCPGQAAVPVLVAHDYGDPVVGYDSGRWASEYFLYANRAVELGAWSGNAANTSEVFGGQCVTRTDAPANAPVVLCSLSNVGHALWNQFLPTFWQFSSAL